MPVSLHSSRSGLPPRLTHGCMEHPPCRRESSVKLAPFMRIVVALVTIAVGMGAYSLIVAMQVAAA